MPVDNIDTATIEKRPADDAADDCEAGINSSNNDNNEVIAVDKVDDDFSVDKDILTPLEVTAPEVDENYVRGTCTDRENRDLQSLIEFKYDRVRYTKDSVSTRKQYKTKDGIALQIYQGELLLPETSFSFIVASDPWGDTRITFYIAWIVWCLQITLLSLLTYDNYKTTSETLGGSINRFGFPVEASTEVIVSQYISVFLMAVTSSEIPGAVSQILRGYDTRKPMFDHAFPNTKNKKQKWHLHNLLRVVEGLFAIIAAFITIMQETTVRNVLLSFSTLQAITNLDNIAYRLCLQGFLGMNARAGAIHVIVAKYNYDAYKLPSETKFCGYGSRRVAYLDGKLRYLIMILFVAVAWLSTSIIVINQSKGNYRCSQKIINEDYYKKVEGRCSEYISSQTSSEKVPVGGDKSKSDVPLVVAVKEKADTSISWAIIDPDTMKSVKNAYSSGESLIGGTGKFIDGVYLYYTCLPRNISGVWAIKRAGNTTDEKFFESRSGIYKLKSGVSIDGLEGGEEVCVDDSKKDDEGENIKRSHLIGKYFGACNYDINIGDGKCHDKHNTPECAFDGFDCLVDTKPTVSLDGDITETEGATGDSDVKQNEGGFVEDDLSNATGPIEASQNDTLTLPKPTEVTDIVNGTVTIVEEAINKLP